MNETFLNNIWRKKPALFKSYIDQQRLSNYSKDTFGNWSNLTTKSIRLFQLSAQGKGKSLLLKEPKEAINQGRKGTNW